MRPDVRKYAMERVVSLEKARLDTLRKAHTVKGHEPTAEELYAALKAGKLPLRKDTCGKGINSYTYVKEVFDLHFMDKAEVFNEKAYNKAATPILGAARKAKDFIMLGQDQEALNAIRKFEADA